MRFLKALWGCLWAEAHFLGKSHRGFHGYDRRGKLILVICLDCRQIFFSDEEGLDEYSQAVLAKQIPKIKTENWEQDGF